VTVEVCWILEFAKPVVVLVDKEFEGLVKGYKCKRIIVDDDKDGNTGEYEDIVRRGQQIDVQRGSKGWDDLLIDDIEETDTMVLNCTSGTTSNPKVLQGNLVSYTVRRNIISWNLSRRPLQYNRIGTKLS
jgi:long-subunit acyl-CoA synthetase (AMP-forming)